MHVFEDGSHRGLTAGQSELATQATHDPSTWSQTGVDPEQSESEVHATHEPSAAHLGVLGYRSHMASVTQRMQMSRVTSQRLPDRTQSVIDWQLVTHRAVCV